MNLDFIDTALASSINLFSVFAIGYIYGIEILGHFSIILIYSSLAFLVTYNFIIVPATSKSWLGGGENSIEKTIGITLIIVATTAAAIIIADMLTFNYIQTSLLTAFTFIIMQNLFLTLRRIFLHYAIIPLPSLATATLFFTLIAIAVVLPVSYNMFVLGFSIIFSAPLIVAFLLGKIGFALIPDFSLGLAFLRFSRWMAIGIWFQWLSGNLVQIIIQNNNGSAALGELRIILSSFGFLSIYFQYREIVIAREKQEIPIGSPDVLQALRPHRYIFASILIFCSVPLYAFYCYIIDIDPNFIAALIYGVFQLFVLISIVMRVYLRLLGDLMYPAIGYVGMTAVVVLLGAGVFENFTIVKAAITYLVSIIVMLVVLAFGLSKVVK